MNGLTRKILVGVLGAVVALAVWQWLATAGPLAGSPLPPATSAIAAAGGLLGSSAMWSATGVTVLMAIVGLVIGAVLGVAFGIGIGTSPLAMHATRVPLEFLKPVPPIVILPIVVLVLGPTMQMGVFLVAFGSIWAIAIQAAAGVFDTDPVMIATSRSYGIGRTERLWRVVLPSSLPYIGMAIRVAAPVALIIAVVAGLFGGGPGLGRSLLLAQIAGNQAELFGYVLILGILGLIFQGASQWAERTVLHWHPQYRKVAP